MNEARRPTIHLEGRRRDFDVEDRAASGLVSPHTPRLAADPRVREHLAQRRHIFDGADLIDRHRQEFVAAVAVQFDGSVVDVEESQRLSVIDKERVGDAVEQLLVALLTAAQCSTGDLLLAEVAHDLDEALQTIVGIAQPGGHAVAQKQ